MSERQRSMAVPDVAAAPRPRDGAAQAPPADVGERPARPRHEPSRHPRVWYAVLALLLVAVVFLMFHLTRGLTFNLDEWIVVTERRGPGAPSLLAPHNEHLSILVIAPFLALLKLGGFDNYTLMMVPLVALQVALGVLLFQTARSRVGVGVAAGVAMFALLSGLAYENFLIAGQAGQLASIVAGVAAFLVLDREPSPRNDRLLCILLIVSLCSSGLGIPVLVGVAVELLLTPAGRERLWTIAVPFGLYVLWYVFYGTNRAEVHDYAISALWAWVALCNAAGAIIGERQNEPGQEMLILILLVLAYRVFRIKAPGRVRMAAIATLLVSFYGLTAVSRHDVAPASSSRYLTVGIVFLLLMLVEAARGWKIRAWVPYVVILLALVSFSKDNTIAFKDGRTLFLQRSDHVRASLTAVDLLGRSRVDAKFEIAPYAAPFLEAGHWFDALDGLRGNPADTLGQLLRAAPDSRAFADDTLVRGGGLAISPGTALAGGCRRAWGARTSGLVPPSGIRVQAAKARALTISARRFGPDWIVVGVLPVPAGRAVDLRPLRDAAPQPYRVRAPGSASVCLL